MKRRLSLLLAVVMVLGSFSFAFAANDEIDYGAFLEEKGVLKGDTEGNLNLDKPLERRDSVILLSRLFGVEEEAKAFKEEGLPTWTDNNDPNYNGHLAWAQSNKYFQGHNDTTFGPREKITVKEYAVVLLRALGYYDEAADWKAVFETAKKLGVLNEIEAEADAEVLRGEMAQMTFNALGTKMKGSDKTLAEFLEIEMPAPEKLEVEDVKADNLKEIKVVFNKAVDKDNVEDREIYTTNAGSVKDANLVDDNTVILTLEGKMTNKKGYKLTIRGFKDEADVNKDYPFKAYDNTVPEVVDVVGLGTKAIKVVMSEPVESAKSSNFKVDGKSYYGSVSVTGREIILKPYGSDFAVGDHKLVVASLEDYAEFKSVERETEFTIAEDKEAPTVVEVKGTMERLVVTFSEDVDDATVSKDSIYWGGAKSNKADNYVRLSGNRYAFEFSGSKTLPTYETTVTVKDVKDYSGNEMKAQDVAFKAEIDQTRPEVLEVEVDVNEIEVKFNKRLNKDDAQDKRNYTITDEDNKKVSIKDLDLSADGRTVTISLYSNLKENKEYTLEITGIRDNTKLANTILPYKETITAGNYKRPEVSTVTGNAAKETIHILFNKKMDVETIANSANYMLVYKDGTRYAVDDLGGDVNVIQDGKAVILDLEGCKIDKTRIKNLEFGDGKDIVGVILSGSIQDTSENRVKQYGEVIKFNKAEVTAEAEATDSRTIEIEFSHPITTAKSSDFDYKGFEIDRVVVDGSKDVVIETVKDLDPALDGVKLAVADDNKIETVLDVEVEEQPIVVADKIAPTLEDAEGTINKSATKLTLVLTFDEALSTDYEGLIKRDLTIKRSSDGKSIDMSKADVVSTVNGETVTIVTEQFVEKGTAYEIEITSPSAIRDKAGNKANKTDGAVVAEKIEEVEDEVIVNKDALNAALKAADEIVRDDYTTESLTAFDEALTAAKALPETIQTEVDAKKAAVDAAIDKLVKKPEDKELGFEVSDVDNSIYGTSIITVTLKNIPEGKTAEDYKVTIDGVEAKSANGKFAAGIKKVVTKEQAEALVIVEEK